MSITMNKFRWCFIGAGSLAKTVAFQLNRSGRHEIVSCYTRNYEKGVEFAKKYGGKAYKTPEEAITAEGVDGVYVVTPHNAHYRYVKQALELGKPKKYEKSFTVTAEETDKLIALAKEKDLYLFSDQNIDWITADKAFQQKWMSLMIQCVTSGVKIHIIHNIERNLTEIGEAIRSWLPLYP